MIMPNDFVSEIEVFKDVAAIDVLFYCIVADTVSCVCLTVTAMMTYLVQCLYDCHSNDDILSTVPV